MKHFSEEQLEELERVFQLKRNGTIQVRDGYVNEGDMVWWRCERGPQRVCMDALNIRNAKEFPYVYQIKEPNTHTAVTYID